LIDFINESSDYQYDLIIEELSKIKKELTEDEVELIFVNNKQMQKINLDNRNINKPTDVLSFPIDFKGQPLIGTIDVSLDMAKSASEEFSHSTEDEIKLLFIHGLLHLLGFDHEVDNGKMREKEIEIIKKLNLPDSLILRNDG